MRHEIAPVLGALETPERYREAAARADVLFHAAIDYTTDTGSRDRLAVRALLGAAAEAGQPKRFLYTLPCQLSARPVAEKHVPGHRSG